MTNTTAQPFRPGRCPICGHPAAERTRPFCSRRCADVDLGRWFSGQYRIPGPPPDLDENPPDDQREG